MWTQTAFDSLWRMMMDAENSDFRSHDLIGNRTIAGALITNYSYPDQPVNELRLRYQLIDELAAADVKTLARAVFNPDQRVEVRL